MAKDNISLILRKTLLYIRQHSIVHIIELIHIAYIIHIIVHII